MYSLNLLHWNYSMCGFSHIYRRQLLNKYDIYYKQ